MGISSAAGYSAVVIYVFARYPTPDLGAGLYPIEFYVGNIAIILVAGLVAGEVARQVRGHVRVALREVREVERIRAELETARAIQQALLPSQAPQLAGYDVAGWNQPADQTGGDYFGGRPSPMDAWRSRSQTSPATASVRPSSQPRVMPIAAPA